MKASVGLPLSEEPPEVEERSLRDVRLAEWRHFDVPTHAEASRRQWWFRCRVDGWAVVGGVVGT